MIFSRWTKFPPILIFLKKNLIVNVCWNFSNAFSRSIETFLHYSIIRILLYWLTLLEVHCSNWFLDVNPILHLCDKPHLFMIYFSLCTLQVLNYSCFIKDFCLHVYELYCSILCAFYLVISFSGYIIREVLAFSDFLFFLESVLVICAFLGIYPLPLSCQKYWRVFVHNISLVSFKCL